MNRPLHKSVFHVWWDHVDGSTGKLVRSDKEFPRKEEAASFIRKTPHLVNHGRRRLLSADGVSGGGQRRQGHRHLDSPGHLDVPGDRGDVATDGVSRPPVVARAVSVS